MKKSAIIATFVFINLLFFSCKEEGLIEATKSSDIKVEDGILVFTNEKVFTETLTSLRNLREKGSLEQWEGQWQNYKSVRTAYSRITEADHAIIDQNNSAKGYEGFLSIIGEGENREAVRNIMDDARATLVNHQGVVKIGDTYRLYRYDAMLEFKDKNLIVSNQLYSLKNSTQNVVVEPINRTIKTSVMLQRYAIEEQDETEPELNEYWYGGRKHRVVGLLWAEKSDNTGFYDLLGGISKHQKRGWTGIWYDQSANNLRLQYNAVVRVGANGGQNVTINYDYPVPNYVGYENFGESAKVDGKDYPFTIISFTGFHGSSCSDGNPREVSTSW